LFVQEGRLLLIAFFLLKIFDYYFFLLILSKFLNIIIMSLALIDFLTDEDLEKLSLDEGLLDATREAAKQELFLRKSKQNDLS